MGFTIRELRISDLDNLTESIGVKRSNEEYEWLLRDPEKEGSFKAYVAVDDSNRVFGVIGYVLSEYTCHNKTIRGLIPMSWRVHNDYKGFAGVQLFKKVMELGDFKFAIGGSDDARELYSVFKLSYCYHISIYYKVLRPFRYMVSSNKKVMTNLGFVLYTLKSFLRKDPSKNIRKAAFEVSEYVASDRIKIENDFAKEVFTKQLNQKVIDWLLSCPLLKTKALKISYKKKLLGIAIYYIDPAFGVNRGRIVHIPYLGSDIEIWMNVIGFLLDYLDKEEKCCYVSVMANNRHLKEALSRMWFTNIRRKSKPLFIKDTEGFLKDIPIDDWHLQFTEGDKAYRNL